VSLFKVIGVKLALMKCLGVRCSILNFLVSTNAGRGGESLGIVLGIVCGLGVCLSICVSCSCPCVCLLYVIVFYSYLWCSILVNLFVLVS
jgi:hypothetical protein